MSLVKDFKEFAFKGNVLDMAVAFVLGIAFKNVIMSISNDIIMPVVGIFTGGIDFSDKKVILSPAVVDATGKVIKPENAITYGMLIQTVITFIIVAIILFFIVKGFIKMQKKEEEKPAPPPEPTKEEVLLAEIRDLLKK
jgi:large conductance mechanosensitive channel